VQQHSLQPAADPWREAMLDGDFARAWQISDAVLRQRRGLSCAGLPRHLQWVWDGTPLTGRRVLVRCYHGLGDTIQFIRFVPRIAAAAQSVIVEAQPALLPLLRRMPGIAALYPLDGVCAAWDVAIEAMELPHALRLAVDDLPGAAIPYLAPRQTAPASAPLGGGRRLRLGLAWAAGDWRRERSLPPELLVPLMRLPVDWIGLQLGPALDDPAAQSLARAFTALIPRGATIDQTTAVICRLDLVVSVDTMVAHLAGALGRPVWMLLDAAADWRWMRGRVDSPWYPTMRLFRQSQPGGWQPVIADLRAALARALADPAPLVSNT